MGFAPMQPQLAPMPLMSLPFNANFVQPPGRLGPTNIKGNQHQNIGQQPPPSVNAARHNDNQHIQNQNNVAKNNHNHIVKNNNNNNAANNNNNAAKDINVPKFNKNNNKPFEKSPPPEALKPAPTQPVVSSKCIVSNPELTKSTNDTRLALLKLKGSKVSSPSPTKVQSDDDTQEVDPNILSFLKSAVERNKERRMSSALSRSSSLRSVCSTIPANLQGAAIFPESNSSCLVVGNELIRCSLSIRPVTAIATKEYNDIMDLINNQGKQCKVLEKYPKEGEQVLYFKDGIFCRAYVVNVDESVNEIDLYLIDTCEHELNVKFSDLKSFPSELKKLKVYIFRVKLRNCSGTFGESAQQYVNKLIDDMTQVRLQYVNGTVYDSQKQLVNEVVVDLYNNSSNKNINEHLKALQSEDDAC